jgi:membrane protein YdbS with pleckstrin-like domain/ketosteroid isomerase-like protein
VNRDEARAVLARLHEAQGAFYAGGPPDPLRALLLEDIVWVVPGENAIAGEYRGIDAVMDYFARRRELARGSFRMHPGDVLTGDGDHVAALTDGTATIDGIEHHWSTVGLYRLRDGRIAACWLLPLDAAAFDAIWSGGAAQDAADAVGAPPASGARVGAAAGVGPALAADEAVALRPPRHRVSRKAIAFWTARALASWLIVAVAQVVWLLTTDGHRALHAAALVATAIIAAVHAIAMPQWRYRVHRWEVAPQAVYTRAGWLHQESRIAPISRIQTVDSERGPLQQLFGLANVTVTTASAAGPLEIEGLDHDTAQRLVDSLTTAAQATRGDAT